MNSCEVNMFRFPCKNNRLTNVTEEGHLYGVAGSSGGYAETIFRHAAKALFGQTIEGPLEFKTLRNSDFREVALEVSSYPTITVLKISLTFWSHALHLFSPSWKVKQC